MEQQQPTAQERQQGFLAEYNPFHEALARKYGYRMVIVPATELVQTNDGPRVEVTMRFGLAAVPGWTPQEPSPPAGGHTGPPLQDVIEEGTS